jgi:hypothetical protein
MVESFDQNLERNTDLWMVIVKGEVEGLLGTIGSQR